jgi:hypothetical protein
MHAYYSIYEPHSGMDPVVRCLGPSPVRSSITNEWSARYARSNAMRMNHQIDVGQSLQTSFSSGGAPCPPPRGVTRRNNSRKPGPRGTWIGRTARSCSCFSFYHFSCPRGLNMIAYPAPGCGTLVYLALWQLN